MHVTFLVMPPHMAFGKLRDLHYFWYFRISRIPRLCRISRISCIPRFSRDFPSTPAPQHCPDVQYQYRGSCACQYGDRESRRIVFPFSNSVVVLDCFYVFVIDIIASSISPATERFIVHPTREQKGMFSYLGAQQRCVRCALVYNEADT